MKPTKIDWLIIFSTLIVIALVIIPNLSCSPSEVWADDIYSRKQFILEADIDELYTEGITLDNNAMIKWLDSGGSQNYNMYLNPSNNLYLRNPDGLIAINTDGVDQDVYMWGSTAGSDELLRLRGTYATAGSKFKDSPELQLYGYYYSGSNTAVPSTIQQCSYDDSPLHFELRCYQDEVLIQRWVVDDSLTNNYFTYFDKPIKTGTYNLYADTPAQLQLAGFGSAGFFGGSGKPQLILDPMEYGEKVINTYKNHLFCGSSWVHGDTQLFWISENGTAYTIDMTAVP